MASCFGWKFRLYHWPIFTALWFTLSFITTYAVSVGIGHVYWFFPFISDTGTIPPESCIFGQLLNLGAAFMMVVIYIRYREVEAAIKSGLIEFSERWNDVAVWFGAISCLGMSLVANFQQTATHVSVVHFFGALGAFGIAAVYFMIQTRVSYWYMISKDSSSYCNFGIEPALFYFRLFLTVFFLPLYFACTVCGVIAARRFTGESIIWWTPDDEAFELRLVATFSEWVLAGFEMLYILTFTKEFRNIKYGEIYFECKYQRKPLTHTYIAN